VTRPPKGGSSACRSLSSDLRSTGSWASALRLQIDRASTPASRRAQPGACSMAWATSPGRRAIRAPSRASAVRVSSWSKCLPCVIPFSCCGSALQPALAASVGLHVAEGTPSLLGDPEIELAHILVLRELPGRAIHHDAAVLQNVTIVGILERHVGVLLGQQEAHPLLLVEVLHDAEDLGDDLRRESHGGFVEQDHLRV